MRIDPVDLRSLRSRTRGRADARARGRAGARINGIQEGRMITRPSLITAIIVAIAAIMTAAHRADAGGPFVVVNTNDAGPGSLRDAISKHPWGVASPPAGIVPFPSQDMHNNSDNATTQLAAAT